jgi:hypothetical protein
MKGDDMKGGDTKGGFILKIYLPEYNRLFYLTFRLYFN